MMFIQCKMADINLLLHQIRAIIENKNLAKQEIANKLEKIGEMIINQINNIKARGQKRIIGDDFAALQLPKTEMTRAPPNSMPARYL